MKRIIFLLIFFISTEATSTHWFTYFIYLETEYVQGPWARTGILSESDYRYLAPRVFEDLFGTMKEELAEKLMERLREEKPATYDWDFQLSLFGDTVYLDMDGRIEQQETVMNEVTATMILNSFSAVCFQYPGKEETWTLVDLTLPLFDLVSVSEKDADDAGNSLTQNPGRGELKRPLTIWLVLSGLLNFILIAYLIFRTKK